MNIKIDQDSGIHKKIKPTSENVKIQGRTFERDETLFLGLSATAIEFSVNSSCLYLELEGDFFAKAPQDHHCAKWPRFAVFVDDAQILVNSVDTQQKTVCIFCSQEQKNCSVRIVKISEAAESVFGIKNIIVDASGTVKPLEKKPFKIEVIGDSITCGYGVEAKDAATPFSTQTENVLKSYSYLTVSALDADYSIVSYSGFGIYSGFTGDGNRNTVALLPPLYKNCCFTWGTNEFNNIPWDFCRFTPDLIIINLGTNDASYCKTEELKIQYQKSYVEFLGTVRECNPKAFIIVSLGIMGDELYPWAQKALEEHNRLTGDCRTACFHFDPQNGETEGFGADFHPSEKTQFSRSQALVEFIKNLKTEGKI